MKKTTHFFLSFVAVLLFVSSLPAQVFQNTYNWGPGTHYGYKALNNYPTGYVVAGNRSGSNSVYVTGFDDFGQHQWTIENQVSPTFGFTAMTPFIKAVTNIGTPSNPSGFFIALTGTRNGARNFYTMLTNKTGQRTLERFGTLPNNIIFGGAVQAVNGGYITVGGTNNGAGNVAVVKFTPFGELEWTVTLPYAGMGYSIQPANGGGYVIGSSGRRATRIDVNGNVTWSTVVSVGGFTATDFEEITLLSNVAQGFVLTGSSSVAGTPGMYTARINWNGLVAWSVVNTTTTGTRGQNAVEFCSNPMTGAFYLVSSWANGAGAMAGRALNVTTGAQGPVIALNNPQTVERGFMVRQWIWDRVVVGGVRGQGAGIFGYTRYNPTNPFTGTAPLVAPDDRNATAAAFASDLKVWPNPATDVLNVAATLDVGAWVRVVNMQGQVVVEHQVQDGEHQFALELGRLNAGVYLLQIVSNDQVATKPVVVRN